MSSLRKVRLLRLPAVFCFVDLLVGNGGKRSSVIKRWSVLGVENDKSDFYFLDSNTFVIQYLQTRCYLSAMKQK